MFAHGQSNTKKEGDLRGEGHDCNQGEKKKKVY